MPADWSTCEGCLQAKMPPMVEAKMIARIIQQIMIMIFFCSSRPAEKKHMRNIIMTTGGKVPRGQGETNRAGLGRGCAGERRARGDTGGMDLAGRTQEVTGVSLR